MTYTEEMATSEILLRLASMRNELLQAVNNIEKISKNICYKAEQTENSSEFPNNCDTCKYGEDKHRYAHICNECGVGINNYEPKDEPTSSKMEQVDEPQTELVRVKYHCINCAENGSYKCNKCDGEMYYKYDMDEPQKCSVNGRPYSECFSCEYFRCTADELQTQRSE